MTVLAIILLRVIQSDVLYTLSLIKPRKFVAVLLPTWPSFRVGSGMSGKVGSGSVKSIRIHNTAAAKIFV
jgi:hypothetical protein